MVTRLDIFLIFHFSHQSEEFLLLPLSIVTACRTGCAIVGLVTLVSDHLGTNIREDFRQTPLIMKT